MTAFRARARAVDMLGVSSPWPCFFSGPPRNRFVRVAETKSVIAVAVASKGWTTVLRIPAVDRDFGVLFACDVH